MRGKEVTTSPSRKRPWELHAIVCLSLIAVGASVATGYLRLRSSETEHLLFMVGMTFSLIGLFRGSQIAWWASTIAFAILAVAMSYATWELINRFGFVAHRSFFEAYLVSGICLATFGLLLSVRLRKAFPPRAEPLVADLPAFHAILKIMAPIVFLIAAAFSLMMPILFGSGRRNHSERNVCTSLKTISSAEADFRANDRDWNRVNDFWTGDVQGLYAIVPPRVEASPFGLPEPQSDGKTAVKLIEYSIALADGHPVNGFYPPIPDEACPKATAWYAALRADRSASPPETYGIRNTSRFGFIAYSDDYIAGLQCTFIVNEYNTIYRQKLGRSLLASRKRPPGPPSDPAFRDWPAEDELKARWGKLD